MKSRIFSSTIVLVILLALIAISPAFDSTDSAYADSGQRWTPGEYEPVYGVMVAWEPGSYRSLLTDFVVGVTSNSNDESLAFVIVRNWFQEYFAHITLEDAGVDMDRVEFIYYDLDTVWICDYGPRYIVDENGDVAIIDHTYNRPWPQDNSFPGFISPYGLPFAETEPVELMGLVHGGGNFLCVSTGDAFVSSLVLDENSSKTEQEIKDIINNHFNVDVTIYDRLIPNVDYTGHIDMWMMPLFDSKIVVSEFPSDHPLAKATTDAAAADLESRGYTVYRTPAYNSNGEGSSGGTHYTYTNAAIVNNRVFIPQYGGTNASDDATALSVYQTALPDHEIIQLDCSSIISASGAIHCAMKHVYVPPVKLGFSTGEQTIAAGEMSSIMSIQPQDEAGNPINVTSDTQIDLTSSSAGGTFYSNAGGIMPITYVTISAGTNSASFYYKDTLAGSPVITAAESPDQGWTNATQGETVSHASLDHFTFDNISDQAEDAAFSITITALDAYGNTVTSYTGTNTISDGYGTINPTSTTGFAAGVWTDDVSITSPYTSVTITTSGGGRSGVSNAFEVKAQDIKIEPGEIIPIRVEIINNTDEISIVALQYQVPGGLIIKSISVEPYGVVSVLGNSISVVLGTLEVGNTAIVDLTIEVSRDVIAETSLAGLLKPDYLVLDIKPVETVDDTLSISNLVIERSEEKYSSFIPLAKRSGERAEISMDVTRLESQPGGDHRINIMADDILLHTIDNTFDGDTIKTAGYDVELIINGEVWETREVELESGETKKVVFYLENLDTGEYTVNITGFEAEFNSSLSVNWWLIFTLILIMVFIGYLVKIYIF